MDPALVALAGLFEGGEVEIQNGDEGYLYRGKIATLEFVPAGEKNGALLKITMQWCAKAVGQRVGAGFLPTGGWDEDTTLEYTCNTDLPSPDIGAPHIPNVNIQMVDGLPRLIIHNPYTGELTVLFPRGGSQLNVDNVRWLPDGPRAKAAAQAAG
ncbi:MAG TPA: hypothetical protein VK694_05960 [Verrucomicrobiae bacterium]|nr:hypothetical protein [Verrucomicrobiae bacterium]